LGENVTIDLLHGVLASGYGATTGFEPISDASRREFTERGLLVLRGALTEAHRAALESAADRVYAEERRAGRVRRNGALALRGFLTRDDLFGDLLTHPTTFPYLWNLLGWNVYSHRSYLDVAPPATTEATRRGWHQDGYRQNQDAQPPEATQPSPLFSVTFGFVLSDLSQPGRGAPRVVPGSHRHTNSPVPPDATGADAEPPEAVELTVQPGDCLILDRRLWRTPTGNRSTVTRKVLYVAFAHRWVRPLDDLSIDRSDAWWANRTPIQRQLCGDGTHTANYWGVDYNGQVDDEIPLRRELRERYLLDGRVPWLC
jgi:hypothetical protein